MTGDQESVRLMLANIIRQEAPQLQYNVNNHMNKNYSIAKFLNVYISVYWVCIGIEILLTATSCTKNSRVGSIEYYMMAKQAANLVAKPGLYEYAFKKKCVYVPYSESRYATMVVPDTSKVPQYFYKKDTMSFIRYKNLLNDLKFGKPWDRTAYHETKWFVVPIMIIYINSNKTDTIGINSDKNIIHSDSVYILNKAIFQEIKVQMPPEMWDNWEHEYSLKLPRGYD
jgi:hypothetical protein